MLFLENKAQINKNNHGMMFFMSKQVCLPKISSVLQKNENRPKKRYTLFAGKPLVDLFSTHILISSVLWKNENRHKKRYTLFAGKPLIDLFSTRILIIVCCLINSKCTALFEKILAKCTDIYLCIKWCKCYNEYGDLRDVCIFNLKL